MQETAFVGIISTASKNEVESNVYKDVSKQLQLKAS